ncbi:hypothetical protein OG21DRAFT_911851 [Imleria badia]|jgi:hypothetical protein|nr:hypothetical protein OG21DRAFT_911851 [Imleria badia]
MVSIRLCLIRYVSYVCRHWRDVALDCPTLSSWTYVFLTSPWWTEELLVRSKQASLKLHASLMRRDEISHCFHLVEQVMNHLERIQDLYLQLSTTFTHEVLSKLSSRAPRLQNLEISVAITRNEIEPFPILFDGDPPALRTLELSNCPVPLYSFKSSGLTTLALYHVPSRCQQTMEDLLATLSCMQTSHICISMVPVLAVPVLSLVPRSIIPRGSIYPIFLAF